MPTDLPDKTNLTALNALYDLYNYPSAYRVERFQSITHSFGARENDAWLHFQCKGMKVQMGPSPGKLVMVGAGGTTGADITWKYSGFHLSWSTPKQGKSDVVLVCSGDNSNLHERMMPFMAVQANVEEVCRDPHALWVPVLFEMWKTMDCEVWGLENVFDSEKEVGLEEVVIPPYGSDVSAAEYCRNIDRHHSKSQKH